MASDNGRRENPDIPAEEEEEEEALAKIKRAIESGRYSTASFFSVAPPSSLAGSSSHSLCADATSGARAAASAAMVARNARVAAAL
jgi:hypothetical protein